jgi:hypothetical protein
MSQRSQRFVSGDFVCLGGSIRDSVDYGEAFALELHSGNGVLITRRWLTNASEYVPDS